MPVLLLKSLLSMLLVLAALANMIFMLELFGRQEKRFSVNALKRLHRWNGYFFLALFLLIGGLCLDILVKTRMELNSRITFHTVLALAILLLLLTKIAFVRTYRLYYGQAKVFGLLIALLTFGLASLSGGYYLLVAGFAGAQPVEHDHAHGATGSPAPGITLRTDQASIEQGKALYDEQCIFCHDPHSRKARLGPGHQSILRLERLPVSGRPATPENVARQLRTPYRDMPAFKGLTERQVEDLIAYLNTL